MNRSNQLPVIGVLIVALLGSAWSRKVCLDHRADLDQKRKQPVASGGDVSRLNSFTLALLLGGLRGPMLMALWTSSENQKSDRELDDFDTKVDLIRLLQVEFDGVHLFQIWNKAYNISVQMANVSTKYTTILDAMDYGFSVDRERPDNISILSAIGGLYFDKFGNAAEKWYFSARLMDETLPIQDRVRITFPASKKQQVLRQARLAGAATYVLSPREATGDASKLYIQLRKPIADQLADRMKDPDLTFELRPVKRAETNQAGARRIEHEPILDSSYNILPQYLQPRPGMSPTGDGADGSQLAYLKQFQPYPYGVSPFALGYNYFKRAQYLQLNREGRHAQLSERVVSSRPALSLKKWAEEDWRLARRSEIELLGLPVPREDAQLEAPTQDVKITQQLAKNPLLDEIIWRYNNAAKIALEAVKEYQFHLAHYPEDVFVYASHREGSEAQSHMMTGDAKYLQALVATGAEKNRLAQEAADSYRKAANAYTRHIFRYYMPQEEVADILPPGITRADVLDPAKLPDALLPLSLIKLRTKFHAGLDQSGNAEDFGEIDSYVQRSNARIASIEAMFAKP